MNILVLGMMVAMLMMVPGTLGSGTGNCQCAAFRDASSMQMEPIFSKTLGLTVTCNAEGNDYCKHICTSLAKLVKSQVSALLCTVLKDNVDQLKPAVFFKTCENSKWVYSGLTSPDPICCKDGNPHTCK